MSKKPQRPVPDDFADVALTMTRDAIRARYNCGTAPAHRWLDEMTPEWLAQRKAHFDTARVKSGKYVQAIGTRAFVDKRKAVMPADFVEMACAMTRLDLASHYGKSSGAIHRLVLQLTGDDRAKVIEAGRERKAAASARNALKAAAKSLQGAAKREAVRRAELGKKRKTPGKASGRNWGFNKAPDLAPSRGGQAETAAQHLRRLRYVPVCRGETVNKALKGFWLVGSMPAMPEAEMVALAVRRGLDFDAWRRVA